MEEKITLTVSYENHTDVVLTNSNGDTYTSKSEELMDFLLSSENKNVNVKPDRQIKEQAEKYANEYQSDVSKPIAKEGFIEGAKWMQEQERIFEIDFGGNVLVKIKIKDNQPAIEGCINGYGYAISMDKIIISELPQPPKQD